MQSRGQNQIFLQNLPGPDALQECAATQGREVLLLYTSQNGRYASAVSGRAPGSTSNEPEILFWDTEKPDAHRSMNREKTDSFNRIAISNDGSMLAAANGKDLLLWNAKTAEFLTTLVDE
jgi:WD40 repeat protein